MEANIQAFQVETSKQISQLAASVAELKSEKGTLPSQTVANPKASLCSVTMMSVKSAKTRQENYRNQPPANADFMDISDAEEEVVPIKKRDPGEYKVEIRIGTRTFKDALLDSGSSLNILPTEYYRQLNLGQLTPYYGCIELANRTVMYPEGICRDVLILIHGYPVRMDFVVTDMFSAEDREEPQILLGRSFLATVGADLNFESGMITMQMPEKQLVMHRDGQLPNCRRTEAITSGEVKRRLPKKAGQHRISAREFKALFSPRRPTLAIHNSKVEEPVNAGEDAVHKVLMMRQAKRENEMDRRDAGTFTITCGIGTRLFPNSLIDTGAVINIMPYSIYVTLDLGPLKPSTITVGLGDRSPVRPLGFVDNVTVQIGTSTGAARFHILKTKGDIGGEPPFLILGTPFLRHIRAVIDVGRSRLSLTMDGRTTWFNAKGDVMKGRPRKRPDYQVQNRMTRPPHRHKTGEYRPPATQGRASISTKQAESAQNSYNGARTIRRKPPEPLREPQLPTYKNFQMRQCAARNQGSTQREQGRNGPRKYLQTHPWAPNI